MAISDMLTASLEWCVPLAFFLFGAGFVAIGRLGFPTGPWGYAFCLLGGGYALTLVHTAHFSSVKPLVEDCLWLLGTASLCVALIRRFRITPKPAVKAAIIACSLAAAAAELALHKSVRLETFFIQGGCTILLFHCLWQIGQRRRTRADGILIGAFLLVASILSLQCLGYLFASDRPVVVGAWEDSLWGIMFQYTGFIISILLAFSILLAISIDLIDSHREHANLDPLTGVLNRRGFDVFLQSFKTAEREELSGTLMLSDLDHFKTINDTFGHHVGDTVIAGFASLLRDSAGREAGVARIGGEEFAVFIPSMNIEETIRIVEHVRQTLAAKDWSLVGPLAITASFGVAAIMPGESITSTLRRADENLYRAKREGRNRVSAQPHCLSSVERCSRAEACRGSHG